MDDATRSEQVAAVNAAIESAKVTQTRIADALGLTQPAVSRRMRGEVEWSIAELRTLAQLLDQPLVVLALARVRSALGGILDEMLGEIVEAELAEKSA